MNPSVDEAVLFARLRTLDDTEKFSYCEKGRICQIVQSQMLHNSRTNPETGSACSITEWIRLAAPWGYATCFAAMRDLEELKDIPMEHLKEIPQANFPILRQLSTAVRNEPTVLHAAKTLRAEYFIETIKRDHPNQHIESKKTLRFIASESESAEIEEAIEMAMERGAMNRTEALLMLAVNYRADMLIEEMAKK